MSLPSTNANGQPSIRNFFVSKPPAYTPPPASSRPQGTSSAPSPLPSTTATEPSPSKIAQPGLISLPSSAPEVIPTRPAGLHPQATISPILPEYIPALRRITSLLLPVSYPDSFYTKISDPLSSGAFSRVLLWSDPADPIDSTPKVIGGLVCRPEPSPFSSVPGRRFAAPTTPDAQPNAVYIQSLVLLSPYRQLGLAAALLEEVARLAAASAFACREVYAHVWTDNEDGLRWYLARGFTKHSEISGYYFKLRPDSAWIVRRQINTNGVTSALGLESSVSKEAQASDGTTTIPSSTTTAAANLLNKPTAPPLPALSLPPRSSGPSPNRSPGATGLSFQNARPDMEWNDLPADMHSATASNASSRSSSTAPRKKKDRAYPAAAFGK
ncbi:uncharacterized protein GGS25DRAFT_433424 [Hypoxylon fragiforme]|uniref:uncharacterized protein n=1 Tax=Hypoxylon fragiforme TaxID=63214 RepID=UPI0020C6266A|nr:uncharacterized protein GGS25DRAFT_433424 [Hypoxylon fragiforme]KAI2605510.1 hypothetical protein GGS25DRAFT_433424 [Hypoxylon fragiforme]